MDQPSSANYSTTIKLNGWERMLRKLFITENEASEIASLKIQTLRNWRSQGRGPTYSKIGKLVRYPVEDFIKYLDMRRIQTEDLKS